VDRMNQINQDFKQSCPSCRSCLESLPSSSATIRGEIRVIRVPSSEPE
jgi:epoxyqueuosine reductase QueG